MSLDVSKLEKVVELANGVKRARCPACAEAGQDRSGEHLRIYPDGKFGCCVFAGDHEHRKRIFAFAGKRGQQAITVKVAVANRNTAIQTGVFGSLSQIFPATSQPDSTDGAIEIQNEAANSRTQRTPKSQSAKNDENTVSVCRTLRTGQSDCDQTLFDYQRTLRTTLKPFTCEEKKSVEKEGENKSCTKLKGFDEGVRFVREQEQRMPFLLADGTLSIPFSSPERYHWWRGGQSVKQTIAELLERKENYASLF
jgi:hypothetical protein